MFLILTLIILVAALNIISGLIMLVKEKNRDIGILRTMGLTRGAVLRVFFICGAAIGVVGTILGVGLGVIFTLNVEAIQAFVESLSGGSVWDPQVRFLTRVPAEMQTADVVFTVAIALGLSFLATWYPAWRAARLDPVEALRHE
jgi:lipoprotein-releasing system permease protein